MFCELIYSDAGGYMEDEIKQERKQQKLIPGIGTAYGHGWRQMWMYFLELLLITIVSFLLTLPSIGLYNEEVEQVIEDFITIDLIFIEFQGPVAYILFALAFFEAPTDMPEKQADANNTITNIIIINLDRIIFTPSS